MVLNRLCGRKLAEKEVEIIKKAEGKGVMLIEISAWVCKQCGGERSGWACSPRKEK